MYKNWIVSPFFLIQLCGAFNSPSKIAWKSTLLAHELNNEQKLQSKQESLDNMSSKTPEDMNIIENVTRKRRRKMNLRWCDRDNCGIGDLLRERVMGDHNQIMFDHPATGQVAYSWEQDIPISSKEVISPRVLILVKKNDDELLTVASEAVKELTSLGDIKVMLNPDVAAKLKFYYDVDSENIVLFDPKPVKGFGASHLPLDDFHYNACPSPSEIEDINYVDEHGPDMICTLGGDGILMFASSLFPGSCPPILCVAGGSLGFLTPFSRDEMVNAIRISLGLGTEDNNNFYYDLGGEAEYWWGNRRATQDSSSLAITGNNFPKESEFDERKVNAISKVKFGANYQIRLSMRMRLDCCVINRKGVAARFNVLNEVTIDRGSSPYLAALECFCDNVHLTTVQADGIIFSTPTGSTAYSMAAGGSVVHPSVPAILVTPICPHVLSFRSMIFPDSVVLRCYVPEDARSDAAVAFDGKHRRELQRGDSVQVRMSKYPVPTINKADQTADWLHSLKSNFNFNTRARQRPL